MGIKAKDTNKIALKLLEEKSDDFICRDYQMDLIDNALKMNMVICSDDDKLKIFIMILLIKKYQFSEKLSLILCENEESIDRLETLISRHCTKQVKRYDANTEMANDCIYLIKYSEIMHQVEKKKELMKKTVLLVIENCNDILESDSDLLRFIVSIKGQIQNIHIFGMNEPLINQKSLICRIENQIQKLEGLLKCHVDIGTQNLPRMNSTVPLKEEFYMYNKRQKLNRLEQFIANKLELHLEFLRDIIPHESGNSSDSTYKELYCYCLNAFLKCKEILENLGSWCCCVIARAFIRHFLRLGFCRRVLHMKTNVKVDGDIEESEDKENQNDPEQQLIMAEDEIGRILRNSASAMSEIVRVCSATFDKIADLEEFQGVMSPKVSKLVELLKCYKSSLNFKIEAIKLPSSSKEEKCKYESGSEKSEENGEDDESDFDTTDDSVATDDESAALDRGGPTFRSKSFIKKRNRKKKCVIPSSASQSPGPEGGSSTKNIGNRFLFRAIIPENSDENFEKLCCLVYVNCSFSAYALSKFLEELCSWDSELFFVHPGHVFNVSSSASHSTTTVAKEKQMTVNQEETINQFRRGIVNCLMTTKIINLAKLSLQKCNLVVRFDPVLSLAEYFECKSRVGLVTNTANLLRRANTSVAEAISSVGPALSTSNLSASSVTQTIGNDNDNINSNSSGNSSGRTNNNLSRSKLVHMVESNCESKAEVFKRIKDFQKVENRILERYRKLTCNNSFENDENNTLTADGNLNVDEINALEEPLISADKKSQVNLTQAISLINLYCARLPTDSFTKLTPELKFERSWNEKEESGYWLYRCCLILPINSPYRLIIWGNYAKSLKVAKMSAALSTLRKLYELNELDNDFHPWNKEDDRGNDISNFDNSLDNSQYSVDEQVNSVFIGSCKRRQCYKKSFADCLSAKSITHDQPCYLYSIDIELSRQIPEVQNIKGRKLMISQDESRGLGLLCASKGLEKTLTFPVFTRSGEEEVNINLQHNPNSTTDFEWRFTEEQFTSIVNFHKIMVTSVFRLKIEKNLKFDLSNAYLKLLLIPLNKNKDELIDWGFLENILNSYNPKENVCRLPTRKKANGIFEFDKSDYDNAVVMPNYRNLDYRQYYYVADICYNMHPTTDFPGDNFSSFEEYYSKKYGARITNFQQPLLDADFSVMRLNMTTPRHVNFKGIALPLPSEAKKKSMRESIHQKQFLIPELCYLHPFPATLWHKAVCLPTILHRINQLLLAEQLRSRIAYDTGMGPVEYMEHKPKQKLELDYNLDGGIRTDYTEHSGADGNCESTNEKGAGIITDSHLCKTRVVEVPTSTADDADGDHGNSTSNKIPTLDNDFGVFKADEFLGENEREYLESNSDVESVDSFEADMPVFYPADDDRQDRIEPSPQTLLEALTMLCASDFINLERLETVGDSYLKYCSTVASFLRHSTAHEGRLSYLRSRQVSNINLFQRARDRNIAGYLQSQKFNPNDNWMFPGWTVVVNNTNSKDSPLSELHQEIVSESSYSYCPKYQHFLTDKNLADAVESLVGCYLTTRGEISALLLLKWFNIDCLPIDTEAVSDTNDTFVYSKRNWIKPRSPLHTKIETPEDQREFDFLIEDLIDLEKYIGYEFKDKAYLLQAMTHSSYHLNRFTDCYQRLELLGDAVLDYVITRFLYEDCRRHSPGELTDLRSALVNNNIFAALVVKFGIHRYFKCISSDLWRLIDQFVYYQKTKLNDDLDFVIHHESKQYDETNPTDEEIEIPKCLGDIFESLAGAIFIDCQMDLNVVWRVFYPLFKERIERYTSVIPKSPVRRLLELMPEVVNFENPRRTADGRTRVCVRVHGKGRFYGIGRNYRIAKSVAAKKALKTLLKDDPTLCYN